MTLSKVLIVCAVSAVFAGCAPAASSLAAENPSGTAPCPEPADSPTVDDAKVVRRSDKDIRSKVSDAFVADGSVCAPLEDEPNTIGCDLNRNGKAPLAITSVLPLSVRVS